MKNKLILQKPFIIFDKDEKSPNNYMQVKSENSFAAKMLN